eukprot:TRINITY_DN3082_c0_g1_i7.p1 TRINITY_DN3082_c0_g1~~TRINITY_DN3082_c0_g1_i7.p1  ORF type:complete len:103 (-),score=2.36 TRINITY_DN3082_c0_g1_i7:629-937(-)
MGDLSLTILQLMVLANVPLSSSLVVSGSRDAPPMHPVGQIPQEAHDEDCLLFGLVNGRCTMLPAIGASSKTVFASYGPILCSFQYSGFQVSALTLRKGSCWQ